jgi:alkanesulfonate monooxygenase SsuD/methylene tetrahydromethanopterin reductase-like flavin-dependent oxidoreductase (luciferase family)
LFDIGEVDISVCRDEQRALEFARPYAARILMALEHMGLTHDEIRRLGIEPELATTLKRAVGDGASWREASMQLSNHAIRSCFVAGTPEQCRDQLAPLLLAAEKHQLGQISFTKLGPDYEESIELLSRQVLKD